jgi:hypothetical protein
MLNSRILKLAAAAGMVLPAMALTAFTASGTSAAPTVAASLSLSLEHSGESKFTSHHLGARGSGIRRLLLCHNLVRALHCRSHRK